MSQLVRIDELVLSQHGSLSMWDECYYLMEYTARGGYDRGSGNDLIQNFKKPLEKKGKPEWKWKELAMHAIAKALKPALTGVIDFDTTTIIPVPPSKARTSPLYDDRVLQLLHESCPPNADIRELIICQEDRLAAHEDARRPNFQDIMNNYEINTVVDPAIRENVVIFDDVITAGNHYKACKTFIQLQFTPKSIVGIFIARRSYA